MQSSFHPLSVSKIIYILIFDGMVLRLEICSL